MKLLKLLVLFFTITAFAQTDLQKADDYLNSNGEVFFTFQIDDMSKLNAMTSRMSIIHVHDHNNTVYAQANRTEFDIFLTYNYPFTVKKEDNETGYREMFERENGQTRIPFSYTAYPTYSEYLAIMDDFELQYPNLCELIEIGTSEQNRKLLTVKLSDNVQVNEQEPKFLYVSTMHGDETTGFPIMLRLIEYLLQNYGTDSEITNLLNNNAIYISPLHNPDGTYAGGNNTVSGATRGNANNVDLNRNFPDPEDGLHPDGNAYQAETLAYMAFAEANHFVLACNFHGGTEVVNYPWDTYASTNPDTDYWTHVCRNYADEVQAVDPGYMTGFNNGITNGYDWYEVQGGRQDYMNYYTHAREMTIEISNQKNPPGSQLPTFWNNNRDALINYMKEVSYGLRGVVTDAVTGDPIKASVYISGKDELNTWVETDLPHGDYYRPIKGGTYQVTFEAPCYEPQTVNISVSDLSSTTRNITLQPVADEPVVSDVTINSGESTTLSTTTSGTINWYDSASSNTPLATGAAYNTPNLTNTTNYYVESVITPAELQISSPNNTTNGSFFGGNQALIFDCFETVTLTKVTVNAENSGSFTMELQDSDGNMIQQGTFNVNGGIQELTIDFDIPVGRDLRITRTSGTSLFRNNSNTDYPYALERYINIKRSTAGSNPFQYYYSFYNWKLQRPDCISSRAEVTVTVDNAASVEDTILNNIIMYPNPAKSTVRFSLDQPMDDLSISMYDVLGKQVFNRNYTNTSSDLSIDIANLDTGIYFVRLQTNNSFVTKQLVKE